MTALGARRAPLQIGTWRDDPTVVHLAPRVGAPPPDATTIRHHLTGLAGRGVRKVLTPALSPAESRPFMAAGFTPEQHLHVLRHDLGRLPERRTDPVRLRRVRRNDIDAVVTIDAAAFTPFWRLGPEGLRHARTATPTSRFRVAVDAGAPSGYAIFGRAASHGYLQRLAVHPDIQGRGTGSALVADGFAWLARRGCRRVLVNTQTDNDQALAFYENLGFRREPVGLAVLGADLA